MSQSTSSLKAKFVECLWASWDCLSWCMGAPDVVMPLMPSFSTASKRRLNSSLWLSGMSFCFHKCFFFLFIVFVILCKNHKETKKQKWHNVGGNHWFWDKRVELTQNTHISYLYIFICYAFTCCSISFRMMALRISNPIASSYVINTSISKLCCKTRSTLWDNVEKYKYLWIILLLSNSKLKQRVNSFAISEIIKKLD